MASYRTKPVLIEAYQVPSPGDDTTRATPAWLLQAIADRRVNVLPAGGVEISAVDGVKRADVGDWITRDEKGELAPSKAAAFAATYDLVPPELAPQERAPASDQSNTPRERQ